MDFINRQTIRLKNFDYSKNGAYFITVCTENRVCTLAKIHDFNVYLLPQGEIVKTQLLQLSERYSDIEISDHIIMPNHVHFIVMIKKPLSLIIKRNRSDETGFPAIADIICTFKSLTTKQINSYQHTPGQKFWQRNYYEHIIRNEDDLFQTREYIYKNPINWEIDSLFV